MLDQLKNLKHLAGLLGNADELKEKFEQLQAELERMEVDADAGAGAVRVIVNGKMRVLRVELDPAMIATIAGAGAEADREMVEDLIASATNAAIARAQDMMRDHMSQLAGGLNLPGLDQLMGG